MTRDDITRMAREAGFVDYLLRVWRADEGVEKLARAAYEAGAAAEREACIECIKPNATPMEAVAAIRARGNK